MKKGHLLVISGPSGTGKGTIGNRILEELQDLEYSVSMTTRQPRDGEENGIHYYFTDEKKFMEIRDSGGFIEYARVYDNYYGTPREKVFSRLNEGKDVILEIDVQGAMNVKKSYPQGVFIFILPPSMAELRKRITNRGTDSSEVIERRMSAAVHEISMAGEYDYCVINDDIEEAADKVKAIITAERARVSEDISDLIKSYKEEI